MCTYYFCTVFTLLFTFVQFSLYQQLLLEYSRMFLALFTVKYAFSTSSFDGGPWKIDASALACSILIVSKMSENMISFKLLYSSIRSILTELQCFHWDWGANTFFGTVIQHTTIYSRLCMHVLDQTFSWLTLVFSLRLLEHALCMEQIYSYLIQPLYTCTQTSLQMTYSGQICRGSGSTHILIQCDGLWTKLVHFCWELWSTHFAWNR